MLRGPRLDAPGVLHHVMGRGLDRQRIFRDDRDRGDLLGRLAGLGQAGAGAVYASALLPNHFHLLVRTGAAPPRTDGVGCGESGVKYRKQHRPLRRPPRK